MTRTLTFEDRTIGSGHPTFVIAEIGSNHGGDLDEALRYVDAAAAAGADSVKFQTIQLDQLLAGTLLVDGQYRPKGPRHGARFIETPDDWYPVLFTRAREHGLVPFSAPFHPAAVDLLVNAGVGVLKIASGELTNRRLLRRVAETGLPLIASTGMAHLSEVEEAVRFLGSCGADDVAVLHCVSLYPTPAEAVNLRAMQTLATALDLPVGLSDHTLSSASAVASVALGATIIEKHVTFDRGADGIDHSFAMEFADFERMISDIREVEMALGNGSPSPTEAEHDRRALVRRGVFTTRGFEAGTRIAASDLIPLRPRADHVDAVDIESLVGLVAPREYPEGAPIRWADFTQHRG